MTELLALLSSAGLGVAVTCSLLLFVWLLSLLPEENRTYMDPVPGWVRPIWPLVRMISHFFCGNVPPQHMDRLDLKLQKTGALYVLTAEDFLALCITLALLFPIVAAVPMATGKSGIIWPVLGLMLLMGAALPMMWISDTHKRRDRDITRNLPVFLEYLSMCVDAGLNFLGALQQAVDKGPNGAMKNEFRIVLRDIRSGLPRAEALERMESRVNLKDVTTFVRSVIQAEKMGSSLRNTLQIQAQQRLEERFQRAEKTAMQAPVKLVIPLIMFIFPLTFVILLFPIVVKFMGQT
ncbi:tight adherence protein C [Pseudomonas guineae]|uniref:Tight adherence protein C n=1 Tax=Pseudomonas guineae TaxID=425504 RepID=A0A1I3F2Z2_9PSED|nr:type II secretion system F family protein [Pseudomonas guineae]SFI05594.1 tight adherence protein C [Pseudomonas guineae]|tara:strand:- start:3935 stop:4813 length:879 start_codon:yes stop_codon:yes gene_type:complete